mmetsp:Transcript_17894/g.55886  ORF Transcript_17894/g.55886 Transcript_17894/m.55886 type:complete len:304 (+) Transcript_17894:431-1342(+)
MLASICGPMCSSWSSATSTSASRTNFSLSPLTHSSRRVASSFARRFSRASCAALSFSAVASFVSPSSCSRCCVTTARSPTRCPNFRSPNIIANTTTGSASGASLSPAIPSSSYLRATRRRNHETGHGCEWGALRVCARRTFALRHVRQHLVRVADGVELLLVASLVGVLLHRQLVVRLLDLGGAGVGLDAEGLVHAALLGRRRRRVLRRLRLVLHELAALPVLLLRLHLDGRQVDGRLTVQVVIGDDGGDCAGRLRRAHQELVRANAHATRHGDAQNPHARDEAANAAQHGVFAFDARYGRRD